MVPKNRLEEYFNDKDPDREQNYGSYDPMHQSQSEKLRKAGQDFFMACDGLTPSLIYMQLAQMVVGAIVTSTIQGAEQVVLNGFKLVLDKKLKEFKESGGMDGNAQVL